MAEVLDQIVKLIEGKEQVLKTGNVGDLTTLMSENENLLKGNEKTFRSVSLHYAAKLCNLELLKHLIDSDADVNYRLVPSKGYKERDAVTPLETCLVTRGRASQQQTEACIQLLVSGGADSQSKNNALLYAARQGRLSLLKVLLDTKVEGSTVDVNYADHQHGNSALLLVAFHTSSIECLEYLIEKGANINQQNAQGNTAMHQIVALPGKDSINCLQLLLNKGGNIKIRNNHQDTPLTKSIRQGNTGAVTLLLERLGVEDIHQQDNRGICAIHEAAMWGQYEILNLLLEKGGNVNVQDFEGNTPLILACDKRIIGPNSPLMMKVEHVNLLLEKGAKIELANNNGETPLHNMNVPIEKIDILLQNNANKEALDNKNETPIVKAVRLGAIQHVDRLVKVGADISVLKNKLDQLLDEKGNTILHRALAMEYEYFDVFNKLLKECNFNINTIDRNGNTLLHIIAEQDLSEFLAPVLEHGADAMVANNEGLSPLDIAIQNESVQIVVELLKTNPNAIEKVKSHTNAEGNTLLHRAVAINSEAAVKTLVSYGLDVNAAPKDVDSYTDSGTPLHLAAQKDFVAIASILIESGADVNNQANYDANSPLHVAARFGNPQIVQLLLKHNAQANLLNKDEETPLQMAEYGGSSECINLLK